MIVNGYSFNKLNLFCLNAVLGFLLLHFSVAVNVHVHCKNTLSNYIFYVGILYILICIIMNTKYTCLFLTKMTLFYSISNVPWLQCHDVFSKRPQVYNQRHCYLNICKAFLNYSSNCRGLVERSDLALLLTRTLF